MRQTLPFNQGSMAQGIKGMPGWRDTSAQAVDYSVCEGSVLRQMHWVDGSDNGAAGARVSKDQLKTGT